MSPATLATHVRANTEVNRSARARAIAHAQPQHLPYRMSVYCAAYAWYPLFPLQYSQGFIGDAAGQSSVECVARSEPQTPSSSWRRRMRVGEHP
eukprot:6182506-Pleurochrysis_carterae.AAC.6